MKPGVLGDTGPSCRRVAQSTEPPPFKSDVCAAEVPPLSQFQTHALPEQGRARDPCLFRLQPFQALGKSFAMSDGRKLFFQTGEGRNGEFERLREVAKVMFRMDGKLLERLHSKERLAPRKLQP